MRVPIHESGSGNLAQGDAQEVAVARLLRHDESVLCHRHALLVALAHGAGRFLVLSRIGKREPNVVWKDTVLIRPGETVDILLDVFNPGRWMAHCHIAEHNQSGMMFSFLVTVTEAGSS